MRAVVIDRAKTGLGRNMVVGVLDDAGKSFFVAAGNPIKIMV